MDETESQVLYRVSSSSGVFEYWVYKWPLNVRFTSHGLEELD